MKDQMKPEFGSEYHWLKIPQESFIRWPTPNVMFSTARGALLGVIQGMHSLFIKTLLVPDYFCQDVVTWWTKQGIEIKRYLDGPHFDEPVRDTISVSRGDAVLAVNYFGVRDSNFWERWKNEHNDVYLIEDHSHDPLSAWALNSKADYAFASLRKTFPVPDGGILWSPKGLSLPDAPILEDWRGSALKLAAMILKKDYLENVDEQVKENYRNFQIQGEAFFDKSSRCVALSPWSQFMLTAGYPEKWREAREKNVRMFLDLIQSNSVFDPLFTKWPVNHCPFNAVLLFPSKQIREKYREKLIQSHIYPAVHWKLDHNCSTDNLNLSDRILTIPVDQRYNEKDINRIAGTILKI